MCSCLLLLVLELFLQASKVHGQSVWQHFGFSIHFNLFLFEKFLLWLFLRWGFWNFGMVKILENSSEIVFQVNLYIVSRTHLILTANSKRSHLKPVSCYAFPTLVIRRNFSKVVKNGCWRSCAATTAGSWASQGVPDEAAQSLPSYDSWGWTCRE